MVEASAVELSTAQDPVRWGVLGTGRIARKLLKAIESADSAKVAGIASRDVAGAQGLATEFGLASACSYDDLIADPSIEAIYVSLPNALHAEWAIRAAKAGKHILCEKPLATSVAEADAMIAAAQAHNVLLMEAFMYRFHPQWRRVAEIIREKRIGTVQFVRSSFTFRMDDAADIRFSAELAGGALMDVGCYCVNFARFVAGAGEPDYKPQSVSAMAQWRPDGIGLVDETLVANMKFPNGVLAQFVCSLQMRGATKAKVVGDEGHLEISNPWFGAAPTSLSVTCGSETHPEEITNVNSYVAEVEQFSNCIRTGAPLPLPIEDARANMQTIEALLIAARERREVELL